MKPLRLILFFGFLSTSHAQEFIPQLAIFTPGRLLNEYQDEVSGIPMLAVNLSQKLTENPRWDFFLREKFGYLYKQFLTQDLQTVRLHGANAQLSLDVRHHTTFSVDPGFTLGFGGLFLYQNSTVKDFSFFAPQLTLGPTLNILTHELSDSFTGISFGIEYTHILFSENAYEGVSVTVGVHFSI